ncbi:hypothetical protein MHBO_000304 [Bonamia ostreae]|uniref:Uncharacterized protein n=1 Tax=Bonamia ostreae TaxID=126728 RepID=A0ABV2AGF1_9EUKA
MDNIEKLESKRLRSAFENIIDEICGDLEKTDFEVKKTCLQLFRQKILLFREKNFLENFSNQLEREKEGVTTLKTSLVAGDPHNRQMEKLKMSVAKHRKNIEVHKSNLGKFFRKIQTHSVQEIKWQETYPNEWACLTRAAALRLFADSQKDKFGDIFESGIKTLSLALQSTKQNSVESERSGSKGFQRSENRAFGRKSTRSNTNLAQLCAEDDLEKGGEMWSEDESRALIAFVKANGFRWKECAQSKTIRERHSDSQDCKEQYIRLYARAKMMAMRAILTRDRMAQSRRSYREGDFIVERNSLGPPKKRKRLRKENRLPRNDVYSSSSGESFEPRDDQVFRNRKSDRLEAVEKINYFEENFEDPADKQASARFQIDRLLATRKTKLTDKLKKVHEKVDETGNVERFAARIYEFEDLLFKTDQNELENDFSGEESGEENIVEQFLVKLNGISYRNCVWLTKQQLISFFGPRSAETRISNFQRKKDFVLSENKRLWGKSHHFNPQFLSVDRLISREVRQNREFYLVVWGGGLSVEQATWEPAEHIEETYKKRFRDYHLVRSENKEARAPFRGGRLFLPMDGDTRCADNSRKLHDYQVEGVNWLLGNFYQNRNCILADEMGLGKTVQTVVFLSFLLENSLCSAPFFVVVPLSTIGHWRREAENWSNLRTLVYYDSGGGRRARDRIRELEFFSADGSAKFDLLVTSYEIAVQDAMEISAALPQLLVVDEGHRLKNKGAKLKKALNSLGATKRLLLTGTPIQNNMAELWSLMNFLSPLEFLAEDAPSESPTPALLRALQQKVNPRILRRFKETVLGKLPLKQETVVDIELTTLQKKYYRAIFEKNKVFLLEAGSGRLPKLVNIEMQLRKCCNHPFLIEGVEEKETAGANRSEYFRRCVEASGKLVFLDKLLPRLKAEGHRVLLFSQMTRVLDVLQEYLRFKGYGFERIDGSVVGSARQQAIDRFDADPERFVFLLTTRAGGVGLNLAAADTVVLFDSDWNPQQDLQAQARCHRIGQVRPVMVYRLVTKNSYESEIFRRASVKLGLDKAFLTKLEPGEDGKIPVSEQKHLDEMLRFGAYRFLRDDGEAAKTFCEKDIDSLLASNAHVLAESETPSELQKMAFASAHADASLDVRADDFWEKVLRAEKAKSEMNTSRFEQKEEMTRKKRKRDRKTGKDLKSEKNRKTGKNLKSEKSRKSVFAECEDCARKLEGSQKLGVCVRCLGRCSRCGDRVEGEAYQRVECVERRCRRRLHPICAEKLRLEHTTFYGSQSRKRFRCQRHFCAKCSVLSKFSLVCNKSKLERCSGCFVSYHSRCRPRSFLSKKQICKDCRKK